MDPINYSWGEFYETMTSCEGYKDDEKLQNQFAIIEALEKVKSLEEITEIVHRFALTENEINRLNSPCLDGILKTVEHDKPLEKLVNQYPKYLDSIKFYFAKGLINKKDTNGMMSIAVSHNSIDLVNILLRHTLYKDDLDKAIFKSIDNNNIDIVKTIGKKFSIVDFSMHACMVGSVEILQFLLNTYGEPVDLKKLMFEHAVSSGSCEMVRFLLKRGVEYWSPNALCTAIEKRNFQVTKLLLSCTDKIHDLKKAMIEACKVGSIDTVKLLIDMGVKVQSEIGDHLLYTYDDGYLPTAVNYNQIDMVNFLLDNGANIDGPAQVILQLAIQNATVKMVKLLITRGATITRGCIREAIRKRAWKRDKEILELLLTYKIDNEIIKSCLSEAPEEVQKILTNYMLQ
jgi:hypothetical protein